MLFKHGHVFFAVVASAAEIGVHVACRYFSTGLYQVWKAMHDINLTYTEVRLLSPHYVYAGTTCNPSLKHNLDNILW